MVSLDQAAKYFEFQNAGAVAQPGFSPWTLEEFRQELASPSCQVFELTGELDGFVFYRALGQQIEIIHLAVRQKGRGHGTQLLMAFFETLRKTVNLPLEVFLEVSEHNSQAIRCYQKMGFARLGIRKNYYRNGDSAVAMKLDILSK